MARTYNNGLSSKESQRVVTASENPHYTSYPAVQVFFFFSPAPWAFFFLFILFFVSSLLQFDDIVCNTGVSMLMY